MGPQQPYQRQPANQPVTSPNNEWGLSSLGNIGAYLMGSLAYLLIIVPFFGFILQIILFAIERNRFAKFHAAQAMLLSIVAYVIGSISFIVTTIFTTGEKLGPSLIAFMSGGIGLLFSCVFGIVFLVLLGFWLWGLVSSFTGKVTKLPVIGEFAERLAGGPLSQS